jgi:hypothetical protein
VKRKARNYINGSYSHLVVGGNSIPLACLVCSVDIERVLWVSLHSNDLAASLGRYIHQNAFELVIDGSRLDLNDDAEAWHFAMNSVSGCD